MGSVRLAAAVIGTLVIVPDAHGQETGMAEHFGMCAGAFSAMSLVLDGAERPEPATLYRNLAHGAVTVAAFLNMEAHQENSLAWAESRMEAHRDDLLAGLRSHMTTGEFEQSYFKGRLDACRETLDRQEEILSAIRDAMHRQEGSPER